MKRIILLALIALVYLITPPESIAVTAKPGPVEYTQPDGSKIMLLLKGDEHIHWATTLDGYTILSNATGTYVYAAIQPDGKLGFSAVQANDPGKRAPAETTFLQTLSKGLFFSKDQIAEMKAFGLKGKNSDAPMIGGFPTTGVRKLLMILANFSNTTTTYLQSDFNNYMNQVNYNGTGSFRDYYLEVSYGLLTVNTTVTIWVVLPHTHDYYGPDPMWGDFAYDAVVAANNQAAVNYAEYDNNSDGVVDGVAIIHQGRGQEESGNTNDIWSHSWELSSAGFTVAQRTFDGVLVDAYTTMPEKMGPSSMGNIGVMCHEFGHNLGAPDFYDVDYSTGGQYEGTGDWDCMAGGTWNGASGTKPAHHNAWTKNYFGWTTPVVLTTAQTVLLRNAQVYQDVVKYNTTSSNEYFIVENRQQTGFDVGIPGHGLIIYHADGNYITAHLSNNDINVSSHQGFYPMAANSTTANGIMSSPGTINSSGCPWPGTTSETTFTDASMPNAKSWAGVNTALPLINIVENTVSKEVNFCFISCAPSLNVTPPTQNVSTTAGTTSFTVTTTSAWTSVSNQTWCTVNPSGTGNGTITANYTQNLSPTSRTANITVTVASISPVVVTVVQAGTAPSLSITPPNQNVPATPAGNTSFAITANVAWTAVSSDTWCIVPASGTGNGTLVADYTANPNTTPRTATISVTGAGLSVQTVTVTQSGSVLTLSVTPPNQTVTSPAGNTSFSVTSNSNWTSISDATWCLVTSAGSGDGTLAANYQENISTAQRIASITVTVAGLPNQVVTVTQAGAAPILSVTPPDQIVTQASGSAIFTVTTNAQWSATSNVSWCSVTPSGSGNGNLVADFTENATAFDRMASLTVTVSGLTPQVVTIHQLTNVGVESHPDITTTIAPNPTTGRFHLISSEMKKMDVIILDMTGRKILSRSCTSEADLTFDLTGTPQGCYLVKVMMNNGITVHRLIVGK